MTAQAAAGGLPKSGSAAPRASLLNLPEIPMAGKKAQPGIEMPLKNLLATLPNLKR
jgi:hypothetical protein